jgi:SAM-dependent methyltransferase
MADPEQMEAAAAVWRRGDYGVVGDWFVDASQDVLAGDDGVALPLEGARVLDVACGSGNVSIAAARRGAEVVGVDVTPEMLDLARSRAEAEGVRCRFVRGSFDDLGGFGVHDVVASAFGVMFAADPVAVAGQLIVATRPGGLVTVAAWHPDGALGGGAPKLRELMPPGGVDTTRWADPGEVLSFFAAAADRAGRGVDLVSARHERIAIPFASPADALDTFLRVSGGWMATFETLAARGHLDEARAAVEAHLGERSDRTAGGIALRADYQVTQLSPR